MSKRKMKEQLDRMENELRELRKAVDARPLFPVTYPVPVTYYPKPYYPWTRPWCEPYWTTFTTGTSDVQSTFTISNNDSGTYLNG